MSKIRTSMTAVAAALMALSGGVMAQSNTDERTTPAEMQRGVPGVDVDTGSRAEGAVDVDTSVGQRSEQGTNADAASNA